MRKCVEMRGRKEALVKWVSISSVTFVWELPGRTATNWTTKCNQEKAFHPSFDRCQKPRIFNFIERRWKDIGGARRRIANPKCDDHCTEKETIYPTFDRCQKLRHVYFSVGKWQDLRGEWCGKLGALKSSSSFSIAKTLADDTVEHRE